MGSKLCRRSLYGISPNSPQNPNILEVCVEVLAMEVGALKKMMTISLSLSLSSALISSSSSRIPSKPFTMRIRKSVPNSPSSSFSSSSLTTNSLASSTDSSSSPPFHFPSSSPARCRGLDLLVKAIHQVTVGSAVGFPYIQKRVVRRRRRALCFDKLSITQVKIGKPTSSALGKESQRRRRSMAVPSKYQDSVLQSWRPKTARSVKVLDS